MRLSGNSGARRFGSKSQSCTPSFQRDMALSTRCTPSGSVMLQPARSDSAPSDKPRFKNNRRSSFATSAERWMTNFLSMLDPSGEHRRESTRYQRDHDHVHHHDERNRGHGEEMQQASALVVAHQRGEPVELDRLPDRQA